MLNKLVFCTQVVNKSNIRRETRNGVEHIVVTSYTLPPDIVMNGILYDKEVTAKTYQSFNRTPATLEHPQIDGNYVLANDPETDMDFRIGAWNENAEIIGDGRVKIDKVVNVSKAMQSDKGKRLLDRIEEIETSSDARPIHTSIGVLVQVNELDDWATEYNGIKTNAKYNAIVTDMVADHDAFLLDSSGAATPSQGTGIGINSENLKVSEHFLVNEESTDKEPLDLRTNQEVSFDDIRDGLYKALKEKLNGIKETYPYIVEIYDTNFIYELDSILYRAGYSVDMSGNVSVQDNKEEVILRKEYKSKSESTTTTTTTEGVIMISRTQALDLLAKAKIAVNADISDADLFKKVAESLVANDNSEQLQVNQDLTSTITQLTADNADLKSKLAANSEKEIGDKIKTIQNCSKYAALPETALKFMANSDAEGFEKMHADSIPSQNIGNTNNLQNNETTVNDDMFTVNTGEK